MENTITATKTFKNKHFTKRDYEATNIVFCEAVENPNPENWVECDPSENTLDHVRSEMAEQGWKKFFGYL